MSFSDIIYKMKCLCVLTVVIMHSSVSHLVPKTHIPIIEGIRTFWGNYATINILFALSGLCSKMKINQFLVASTTFTYMTHMYITAILRNSFIVLFPKLLVLEIIAYFLTWMVSIILCVGIYKLLKTYTPRFLGILVGGRV